MHRFKKTSASNLQYFSTLLPSFPVCFSLSQTEHPLFFFCSAVMHPVNQTQTDLPPLLLLLLPNPFFLIFCKCHLFNLSHKPIWSLPSVCWEGWQSLIWQLFSPCPDSPQRRVFTCWRRGRTTEYTDRRWVNTMWLIWYTVQYTSNTDVRFLWRKATGKMAIIATKETSTSKQTDFLSLSSVTHAESSRQP